MGGLTLPRDDGGAEGPERGAEARSAGAPMGCGLVRGAVAPPQFGSLGALPPEKFSNLTCKSMHFHATFALHSTLNLMTSFT